MRIITLICISFLLFQPSQKSDERISYFNPNNVPDEAEACLKLQKNLEINSSINPFIISGGFDGDNQTDFAIAVRNNKDGHQGILFCFAKQTSIIAGAGESIPGTNDPNSDWPFDSWFLVSRTSKHLPNRTKIKFDALAVFKADEGGGIVYWDGRKLQSLPED